MERILVLTPRGVDLSVINAIENKYPNATVTTTVEAYNTFFKDVGSWEAWVREMVNGVDYISQEDHYTNYLCIDMTIGKGNSMLVEKILENGKPCNFYNEGELFPVTGVRQVGESWVDGFEIDIIKG